LLAFKIFIHFTYGYLFLKVQATSQEQRTWTSSVPKEILDKVSKNEMKRQEIIFETIYTEDDYVKDLDLLDSVKIIYIWKWFEIIYILCVVI